MKFGTQHQASLMKFGTHLQVALDKQAKPVLPRRAHALPPPVSASRALLPRLTPLHRRWVT